MSVTSEIWIKGHLRRCLGQGLAGVIERSGAKEAGSIYVKVLTDWSHAYVYGPPIGPVYDEAGTRQWAACLDGALVSIDEADAYLARQCGYDPDIWILELEAADGKALLFD